MSLTSKSSSSPLSWGSWQRLGISAKRTIKSDLETKRRAAMLERWPTPGDFAVQLDPTTRNPPHLWLIDAALRDALDGNCDRWPAPIFVSMPEELHDQVATT